MSLIIDARKNALAACEELFRAVMTASPQNMDAAAIHAHEAAENLARAIRDQPHTYGGRG
jgi:hypothetical protein